MLQWFDATTSFSNIGAFYNLSNGSKNQHLISAVKITKFTTTIGCAKNHNILFYTQKTATFEMGSLNKTIYQSFLSLFSIAKL